MDHSEQTVLCEKVPAHDWRADVPTPEDEEKVKSGFEPWHEKLRNTRLADKARRLWQLFKAGKLSGFDKALLVGALLYCIAPVDLVPDIVPVAGYLDDLAVVLGVLAYLDGKTG